MSITQSSALAPSSTQQRTCEGCGRSPAILDAGGMCEMCADGIDQYNHGRADAARVALESTLEQTLQWLPEADVLSIFQRAVDCR